MTLNTAAIEAQAGLHHQYLLGLELMVATREGPEVVTCRRLQKTFIPQ